MKKKYITLGISAAITLFIFYMSLSSGSKSGQLSSGLTVFIKDMLDELFIGNKISLESLHIFIRKSAHVFEYFILGVSYYFTAKAFKLSILKVFIIGLITGGLDEFIQTFVPDRAGRLVDVLVFDFGGFILGLSLMLLLFNRKKDINEDEILYKIANKEISYKKGYKYLYKQKSRLLFTNKAHFIKLSIEIPNEKRVNTFLKILFIIPLPLFLVRFVFGFFKNKIHGEMSIDDIKAMINTKGVQISIKSASGENIIIKTF